MKLNTTELNVLLALADNMMNNGGDFGFTDEIDYKALGLTDRQYAGYVGQLTQKGLIWVDNPVVNDRIVPGQTGMNLEAKPFLIGANYPHVKSFEAFYESDGNGNWTF